MLFGKLKNGGHVRVVVIKNEQGRDELGFEYLDGPVTPKPEKIPAPRGGRSAARRASRSRRQGRKAAVRRGSVPKVPLKV